MAYTKTNWNENTPITADKLNKMETGIANGIDKSERIMEIPITNSDGWQQFKWTKPGATTVSWTRDANGGKALEVLNETTRQQLLLLKDDGGLEVKKYFTVDGGDSTGYADISLLYNGRFRGLLRGLSGGGLQLHSYNEDGTWATYLELAAGLITLGSNIKVGGNLTTAGNLYPQGNLVFSKVGDGGLNACIANSTLQANTGNGQMMNVGNGNIIYVGNPNTPLTLESNSNPIVNIGGGTYQLFHTGNFNPDTKLNAGNFSIHNRDLKIHGKRALVGFNTADGNYLSINYDRDFAEGVRIQGLVQTETLAVGEKLTFSNIGGSGITATIANSTLHAATGNGQMMNVGHGRIFVGNPNTRLSLESSSGIIANIGGTDQRVLTDRDSCHRFSWTGSRISIDGGGNNAAVSFSDTSEVANHIRNHHTGRNFKFRADAGLGPLEGEITFTW